MVDANDLYFTDPGANRVVRVPLAGGTQVPIGATGPGDIQLDGTNVFFTVSDGNGSIRKYSKASAR